MLVFRPASACHPLQAQPRKDKAKPPTAPQTATLPPSLTEELIQSAHPERINGVAFPIGYSEVFATASPGAVRVWHLDSCRELLRIAVANLECKCLAFAVVRGGGGARGRGGAGWTKTAGRGL